MPPDPVLLSDIRLTLAKIGVFFELKVTGKRPDVASWFPWEEFKEDGASAAAQREADMEADRQACLAEMGRG